MKQIDLRKLIIGLELVALVVLKSIGTGQNDAAARLPGPPTSNQPDHHLTFITYNHDH
jgi:hypothetical protein